MCYSEEATDTCTRVDSHIVPLVDSFYRLARAVLRRAARRRSISKKVTSEAAACRPPFSPLEIQNPSSPNDNLRGQHHLDLVRKAHPPFSFICNQLGEGDIHMPVRGFPIRAGGFADLWRGYLDNRQVAIKSYRRYLSIDPSQIFLRFSQEALVCSRLSHKNIVSFIGVYSTEKHPFSLAFDFAGHFDLREYIKTNPMANRLELLAGVARGLDHMHDLDIVHGRFETENVLVDFDGTARIAGLGSALILDHTTVQSETSAGWSFRGSAPELILPEEFGLCSSPRNSKAGDVYAFGTLAWEVFTGRAVFSGYLDVVAAHIMWKGVLPPRPNHPEVTDRMWKMMEQCWEREPSKRTTIKGVVRILEAERTANFYGTL